MPTALKLTIGQHSDKGRKPANQDFHGAMIPGEPALSLKGVALALADGISSSPVARDAAESAVKSFLADYYDTPDTWSVKTSAQRVIAAANSWLHAQTRRSHAAQGEMAADRGYVCTLSVLVLKSQTAHLFHVGDARIYRVAGNTLEQLTEDHRVVASSQETYLGRALGVQSHVEIDYRALPLEKGDVLLMATDGVYEHVDPRFAVQAIADVGAGQGGDLDGVARRIVEKAIAQGSPDNLTLQIVRVDALPEGEAVEVLAQSTELPLPPLLQPRQVFDGYRIERELSSSSRSHIYLATDLAPDPDGGASTAMKVALKIPSIDLRADPAYLRRFMMEEWIARRIDNAHVLKPTRPLRKRNFLYVVTEFVDGQTLAQWMVDHPHPDLETVRGIVEQIARGLQAFHRKEMLHQDLRPANVMIDRSGTAKIIDFGSTRVTGIAEAQPDTGGLVPGTHQYTAPECLLGEAATTRADLYSLGVITYQMIAGRLPYGARMAQAASRLQQAKVPYLSAGDEAREVPAWIDGALRKAVHPDPAKRYGELSEFLADLRQPNPERLDYNAQPLLRRNPLLFWQGLSLVLAAALVVLLFLRHGT